MGELTATGFVGGAGTIAYKTPSQQAGETSVTVKLRYISDPENLGPAVKPAFDGATLDDPTMALLYPYDKTVFPRGLTGLVIQWNGGNAGDIYYVRAVSPTFTFEGYSHAPPPSRFEFPKEPVDIWKKLTDSTTGDVTLTVQRYDGATAYLPRTETWTIANANLTGFIYYWEVNTGNVVRIAPGATMPENFIQKPAGVTCVACHSVSKDGSRIVASFHGGYGLWGTFDAKTGASLLATDLSSGFQAISPNGSHVLWRHWSDAGFSSTGDLSLSTFDNSAELAQLNPGGGAPAHPVWAGDATKVGRADISGSWSCRSGSTATSSRTRIRTRAGSSSGCRRVHRGLLRRQRAAVARVTSKNVGALPALEGRSTAPRVSATRKRRREPAP